MPKTRGDWLQIIAALGYVGVSIAFYFILRPLLNDPNATKEQLRAAGVLGPIVYVGLYTVQIFMPFLPGVSMDMVAGALWGYFGTMLLSQTSAALAGFVVIWVVRKLGLQTLDEKYPALLKGAWRFVRLVERWPWTLAIVSTLVGDVGYFVAGATGVRSWKACLVLGLARIPGITIYATLGWALQSGLVSQDVAGQFSVLVPAVSILTVIGLLVGVAILSRYGKGFIARFEARFEAALEKSEKSEPSRQEQPMHDQSQP
jgi:uncharacterized membrane protein YdjX (TVP38/TMEM64 family)